MRGGATAAAVAIILLIGCAPVGAQSIDVAVTRLNNAASGAGGGVRSALSDQAPLPDAPVSGDTVTVTDFKDVIVSVRGVAPAATAITLKRQDDQPAGSGVPFPFFMTTPLSAALTVGTDHFAIVSDQCSGVILGQTGGAGSTCPIAIQPRASWWGAYSGNLAVSSDGHVLNIPLSGVARHFDPLALSLTVAAGNPSGFTVDGGFNSGDLFGGAPASAPQTVTFRVSNLSSEYSTPPLAVSLSNSVNFVVNADGCNGQIIPPLNTCDIVVGARATWWGSWAGALKVVSGPNPDGDPDITLAANLAGSSSRFDPPRLSLSTTSGDPAHVDASGPTKPSYSTPITLRIKNLSTEFPTSALSSSLAESVGAGTYEFTSNGCSGASLATGGTCDVSIRHKASWWGVTTSTYNVSGASVAGGLAAAQALSGRASHFDPPTPTISLVSGSPSSMYIGGWAQGVNAYSMPVVWRVANASTEEATSALSLTLSNTTNFEFASNGCAGNALGVGATCDVSVRGKASANGGFSGTLTVDQHTRPSVAMSGSGSGFYTYTWAAGGWSGCSQSCGGGSQTRSVWCRRSDGANMGDTSSYPGCEWYSRPGDGQQCNTQSCCNPNDYISGYGSCNAYCGGGNRDVYWRNDCQNRNWTSSESCNTQDCGECNFSSLSWGCELQQNQVGFDQRRGVSRCGDAPSPWIEGRFNGDRGRGCSCKGRIGDDSTGMIALPDGWHPISDGGWFDGSCR